MLHIKYRVQSLIREPESNKTPMVLKYNIQEPESNKTPVLKYNIREPESIKTPVLKYNIHEPEKNKTPWFSNIIYKNLNLTRPHGSQI